MTTLAKDISPSLESLDESDITGDPMSTPTSNTTVPSSPDSSTCKESHIQDACRWRNLSELRALALSPGGFLSDRIRQQAWPVLLGLPPHLMDSSPTGSDSDASLQPDDDGHNDGSWKELHRHRDEDQVQLDVNRAFVYYPNNQNQADLDRNKERLSTLITSVLRRHPYLCYFQGYHDICQVLLLVLPPPLQAPAVARLSALRIRDFMLPSLGPAIAQLRLIPDILRAADPPLWEHLGQTEPFFALSGTLTMYAHDITSLGDIARLFDVLLAREPVFSIYMFAAIVRSRRTELFDTPADEPDVLHSILSKLPRPLDIEGLIAAAVRLHDGFPPERLPTWPAISTASVLKTARDPDRCAEQSLDEGRRFFHQQLREMRWEKRRNAAKLWLWKHRQPGMLAAAAVVVSLAAVWFSRSTAGPVRYLEKLWLLWNSR